MKGLEVVGDYSPARACTCQGQRCRTTSNEAQRVDKREVKIYLKCDVSPLELEAIWRDDVGIKMSMEMVEEKLKRHDRLKRWAAARDE